MGSCPIAELLCIRISASEDILAQREQRPVAHWRLCVHWQQIYNLQHYQGRQRHLLLCGRQRSRQRQSTEHRGRSRIPTVRHHRETSLRPGPPVRSDSRMPRRSLPVSLHYVDKRWHPVER
ncbi:unnamed protein product [Larinioides sclopetarius]|uniref:Uncharacterized protein n=1 Tax=Larinioides sclopetarius TaxID=280406 RepID=A0AAV2B5H9_9ARAC